MRSPKHTSRYKYVIKVPTRRFFKDICATASFSKACRANIYLTCEASGCETRFPHYADYAVTTVTNRRAGTILKPPSDSKHTLYIPRSDRWADLRDRRQGRGEERAGIRSDRLYFTRDVSRRLVSWQEFGVTDGRVCEKTFQTPLKIMQNAKQTRTKYRENHRLIQRIRLVRLPRRVYTS